MNKQELIEELECLEVSTDSVDYLKGADYANERAINLAKQLDEPIKVVVPKFVAEWIEYAKKKGDSLIVSFNPWDLYGAEYIEATRWIDNNQETFALAWVNGYEVEKEQLYYVKLPGIGYLNNSDGGIKHTEKEIKAIDKRYWPFAVKVDGE